MLKPLFFKGLNNSKQLNHALHGRFTNSRRLFLCFFAVSCLLPISLHADSDIIEISHTPDILGQLADTKLPIILVISSEYCGYCTRLEKEQLLPLQQKLSKQYEQTVVMRSVTLENKVPFSDFAGDSTRASKLSRHYDARITPTVLFLDHKGEEIAKRLVGYNNADYYSYYFEQAFKLAEKKLNTSHLITQAPTPF